MFLLCGKVCLSVREVKWGFRCPTHDAMKAVKDIKSALKYISLHDGNTLIYSSEKKKEKKKRNGNIPSRITTPLLINVLMPLLAPGTDSFLLGNGKIPLLDILFPVFVDFGAGFPKELHIVWPWRVGIHDVCPCTSVCVEMRTAGEADYF